MIALVVALAVLAGGLTVFLAATTLRGRSLPRPPNDDKKAVGIDEIPTALSFTSEQHAVQVRSDNIPRT